MDDKLYASLMATDDFLASSLFSRATLRHLLKAQLRILDLNLFGDYYGLSSVDPKAIYHIEERIKAVIGAMNGAKLTEALNELVVPGLADWLPHIGQEMSTKAMKHLSMEKLAFLLPQMKDPDAKKLAAERILEVMDTDWEGFSEVLRSGAVKSQGPKRTTLSSTSGPCSRCRADHRKRSWHRSATLRH